MTDMQADNKDKQQQQEVVYEMFVPLLYRGKDKDAPQDMDPKERLVLDRQATERRVFWVFRKLGWGFVTDVRVFGFENQSSKTVSARIRFSSINESADALVAHLDDGGKVQVHYEEGKPWYWNVVKYTPREPKKTQVTYTIVPRTSTTPPPAAEPQQFKLVVKTSNKFKSLAVEGAASDSDSESK